GETKNQRRGRSASSLVTNKTAPEQSTSETTTPIIMDIDQTPSPKGKEKEKLAACHGIFVLNDMVRVHGCDLPKKDILAKSKFSAKLAGLPRFTTGKQLLDIGHMVNAMAWIILKA
ncbi:14804_t:CDS:2, partial [Funneliformis geosporum]